MLAQLYDVTIDSLVSTESVDGIDVLPPPTGKGIWRTVTISENGKVEIPKEAMELFNIIEGDKLIVLNEEHGLAMVPENLFREVMEKAMESASREIDE